MKKIIDFFKNRIVLSIIGLIALSVLIWFIGPVIKFGADNTAPLASVNARLIAIIVLLVLWGLNNLRIQLMNKKRNEGLMQDLEESQADAAVDFSSEQSAEELHQMNKRFSDALATLKRLKFNGKGRKQALYELPWYIIIGPPGSGKTTALVNSSLDFPLAEQFGKGAVQGIGGTRNCDWWFTNEAVLIDTAGRYTTQDSHKVVDSKAWEAFLKLLKKYRKRRPINGAIVSISLQDLLTQTEQERVAHAKVIRTRIDELMEKLEVRFPIYLMFTKTDLVSGFSEYFEDLNKDDREQVWGISLPNAPKPTQSPDFQFLGNEYAKLLERLYARQVPRMHFERDAKRRAAIQGFPQQMENLQAIIDSFVQQTFVKNRYRFQPYLRGIYFTSGTQDGSPIDRMMSSVSANFGFGRENLRMQHGQGKSFFLGHLFRHVIFPESELVGSNRRYEAFIKWGQRFAYLALAGISIGLGVVWMGGVNQHRQYMGQVESYVAEYNAENKRLSPYNKELRASLPALNALAKASIVYDQENHPWLSNLGLYDASVDRSANKAYQTQLKTMFLPRLLSYLEKNIQKGHSGGDLYHTFSIYLMFQKLDYMDKQLITDWFVSDWKNHMEGEGTRRQELEAHLSALLALELEPVALNANLISATRSLLLRVPVHQRVYSRIKTNPQFTRKIDMLNQFGEPAREAFRVTNPAAMKMPFMFTKEGYDAIDFSADSPVIANIMNDRWVLSDDNKDNVDFVKEDLDEIGKRVKELYFVDYIAHWNRLFGAMSVEKFKSIKHASDALASFADPVYSPFVSVLQVVSMNTTLSSQLAQNLNDDHGEGKAGAVTGALAKTFDGTKVDRSFREINVLLRESNKRPAPITTIGQKLQELKDFMGEISVAPDPNKKAFSVAKARYQNGAGNAITSLRAHASKLPSPMKEWLVTISKESWKITLGAAKQHVTSEWRSRVYEPYATGLAGRYPLKSGVKDELAMYDFIAFFKPKGTVDQFYGEFVKPFISTRRGWKNRGVDGYSLGLSEKTLEQIRRALNIKDVFFRKNPEVPSISFELKPYRMDKIDARFRLEVGEQRLGYNHGPKFSKPLHWSGDDESNRVRIVFEDLDGVRHDKTYYGPWAWFRLQDQSNLQSTRRSSEYKATYEVRDDRGRSHSIQYLIKAKSVNNPFAENLLGGFTCSERI